MTFFHTGLDYTLNLSLWRVMKAKSFILLLVCFFSPLQYYTEALNPPLPQGAQKKHYGLHCGLAPGHPPHLLMPLCFWGEDQMGSSSSVIMTMILSNKTKGHVIRLQTAVKYIKYRVGQLSVKVVMVANRHVKIYVLKVRGSGHSYQCSSSTAAPWAS